jgi:hypothetical protein
MVERPNGEVVLALARKDSAIALVLDGFFIGGRIGVIGPPVERSYEVPQGRTLRHESFRTTGSGLYGPVKHRHLTGLVCEPGLSAGVNIAQCRPPDVP